MPVSDQLSRALCESGVYVDENGYAHDDEGNRWFVGKHFAAGEYGPNEIPTPGSTQRERSVVDNSKRIAACEKLPEAQRTGAFGSSIMSQLRAGRTLSDKQKSAIRQMFYRARLRDLADVFR